MSLILGKPGEAHPNVSASDYGLAATARSVFGDKRSCPWIGSGARELKAALQSRVPRSFGPKTEVQAPR